MNDIWLKIRNHGMIYFYSQIFITIMGAIIYFNYHTNNYELFVFIPIFTVLMHLVLNYNVIQNKDNKKLFIIMKATGYLAVFTSIIFSGGINSILLYFIPIATMFFSMNYGKKHTQYTVIIYYIFILSLWILQDGTFNKFLHFVLPLLLILASELLFVLIIEKELISYEDDFLNHKDKITGLNNFRFFQQFLDDLIEKKQKSDCKFAIYLLDIEDFQKINNLFGYIVANQIFVNVAKLIKKERCFDKLCYYSGGCFIALNEVNDIDEAERKVKNVKQLIVSNKFIYDSLKEDIKINVGWAVYPFHGINKEKLLVEVHEKLNHVKKLRKMDKFEHDSRIEKLSLIGQLAAGFAHEIRNPITTVKGFCQLVKENPLNDKNSYYMNVAISELRRINQLLTDFLKLSRSNQLKLEKVNVNKFLNHIKQLISPQIRLHDIDFQLIQASGPDVLIDKEQMTQVFLNILINSVDAVKKEKGRIVINYYFTSKNFVVVEIIDNGEGIDESNLNKIFEPFYSSKEKGTGLGLAISYKIVEAHGGDIRVRSIKNEGSVFKIILPTVQKKMNANEKIV